MGQRLGVRQSREPMTRSVSSTRLTSTHDGLNLADPPPVRAGSVFTSGPAQRGPCRQGCFASQCQFVVHCSRVRARVSIRRVVVLDRDRRGSMLASRILPRQCSAGNNLRSVTWDVPLGIERSSNPRGDGVPGVCSFRVPTPFQNPASQVSRLIIHPVAIVSRTDWLGGGIYE